ncbi:MAG: TIR domain-containing protein [Rhizomicrobium sp.]
MAHDVFISYSSKDRPVADAACAALEARGIRCWIAPRDIAPGANWAASIPAAIAAAKVLLLIFSASANGSDQVQREVDIAATRRLTIIPLRVENVLPQASLEYYINQRHWLDAFTPPLEHHLARLVEAIGLIVSGEAPAAAEAAVVVPPRPPRGEFGRYGLAAVAAMAAVSLALGLWLVFRERPPPRFAPVPVLAHSDPSYDRDGPVPDRRLPPAEDKGSVVFAREHCATRALSGGVAARFCASSVLGTQSDAAGRTNTYGPQNLFDNDPATAWCEGVPGPGNGQAITVSFSRPQIVKEISFINGYAKSAETFAKNNSVRTLTVTWPDGTTSSLGLADRREPYSLPSGHAEPVRGLSLRIDTVNGGSKWPDTCLSEIVFSLRDP